jgi:hypothetical protein
LDVETISEAGETITYSFLVTNTGNVTLDPRVEVRAQGLFGRTLLARDLTRIPSELLPGQRVRLTEPWRDAPQLDWGDITLTAYAKDTRESASVSFFALPWLMAVVVVVLGAVGSVLGVRWFRGRRDRARPFEPAPPSPPGEPTPSRPRSSPSVRP